MLHTVILKPLPARFYPPRQVRLHPQLLDIPRRFESCAVQYMRPQMYAPDERLDTVDADLDCTEPNVTAGDDELDFVLVELEWEEEGEDGCKYK